MGLQETLKAVDHEIVNARSPAVIDDGQSHLLGGPVDGIVDHISQRRLRSRRDQTDRTDTGIFTILVDELGCLGWILDGSHDHGVDVLLEIHHLIQHVGHEALGHGQCHFPLAGLPHGQHSVG